VSPVVDPLSHEPLLQLEYTLPRATAAGVWAKRFPEGVNTDTTDVVRVRVWAPDSDQLRYVTGTLEMKGADGGIQRIPLDMHPGSRQTQTIVDWPAIGTLSEVVVAISRTGDTESVTGQLFIDVSFARRSVLEKLGERPLVRIGGNLLAGLLAMLATALIGRYWTASPEAAG